jgi:CobQ-like glutamine amidotransferase family enzyme
LRNQKTNESALGCVTDGKGNNANASPFEATYDFKQLTYTILQKDRELAYRWIVATTHCLIGCNGIVA